MQQTSGEGEENIIGFSLDANCSETQFGQDNQHHQDLPSELDNQDYQTLDTIMNMAAFSPVPETQAGEPSVIDNSSQDQINRAQDATHAMLQDIKVQNLQGHVHQLEMQLTELDAENENLCTGIERIEITIDRIERDIARAENSVKAAELQRSKMQQSYDRTVSELMAQIEKRDDQIRGLKAQVASHLALRSQDKAIANSRKVSDDDIKASWRTMAYNIESLVATILTGRPSQHDLDHHEHEDKEESCAFCQLDDRQIALLQNENTREIVVEKLVWDAVTRRVFPHNGICFGRSWDGAPGQLLSALFNRLLRKFSRIGNHSAMLLRWKAESAAMIDRVIGVDDEEMNTAADEEHRGLCAFISHECPDIAATRQSLCQQLRNIFKEAAEIHRIFMQSRAHFYLDVVNPGEVIYYNPEFHKAEEWDNELSERSIVLLGISPSLVKVGNADGGKYDKSNRLIKASVICN
ncbi:hypothetical protein LX36DRAFT_581517 [Colletotrichum falcatum]|nr:hypothetical protein LX36DRAFT_581517 [Colletotrichum falcatum]